MAGEGTDGQGTGTPPPSPGGADGSQDGIESQTGAGEEGTELTWESLATEGITSPADVMVALERERKNMRTWEDRANAHRKELDALRRQGLPDDEKAKADLRDEIRAEVVRNMAPELARSEFLAAATGRVASVEDALELIDLGRFVGDDGKVDKVKIQEAVDRLAKLAPANGGGKTPPPKVDKGTRTGGRPNQLTQADLKKMSPEAIMAAQKAGQLDDLLTGKIR
jgi:hypothetical protein